jgi:hypothetical protein
MDRPAPPTRHAAPALVAVVAVCLAIPGCGSGSGPRAPARLTGGAPQSLFLAKNLDRGRAAVRHLAGQNARLFRMTVEPGSVLWQVQRTGDQVRTYQWDGRDLSEADAELPDSTQRPEYAFPLETGRGATVERVARAAAAKFDGTLDNVTALTLEPGLISHVPEWVVNVRRGSMGRLYLADSDGRHVRRPGER